MHVRRAVGALIGVALPLATLACGASEPSSHRAANADRSPSSAERSQATLWAVGDGADGGSVAKGLARRIARDRPKRFLYLGDVYDAGSAQEFRDHYAPVYGDLAHITAPTPGNHDWPARRDGYEPY